MSTVVVIGGGVSGLASAFYLNRSAKFSKIILLETSSRFGGWMKTLTAGDGSKMELGPRSIRPAGPQGYNTLCLIEDLNIDKDLIHVSRNEPSAKNRFVYANDKLNKLPSKFSALFTTQPPFSKPLASYGVHDLFTKGGHCEDETVYSFFARRFNEDLAKYAIDPMCRGIFAGDCRQISIASCFPPMHEAEKIGGSMILGMYKNSRNKPKPQRKCTLSDRVKEEKWSTYSFKQGLQHLSDSVKDFLANQSNVELVTEAAVSNLSFHDNQALVEVNGDVIKADHVISSIYAGDLAKLLEPGLKEMSEDLSRVPAVDTVVVCAEFDGSVQPPTPGFGHLLPSFENAAVLGVIYDSCTFPAHDRTDKPSSRFTVMMGGAWSDQLRTTVPSMTLHDLGHYAISALQSQIGITATPVKIHVEILPNCIPQYLVGHKKILEGLFRDIEEKGLPLSLVGSSYKGPAVNDCINNARLEVERITGSMLQ